MEIPIFQVDAFANRVFSGNPACVCPLPRWLDDERLLAIAEENNLAETAFLVRDGERWQLRWFSPTTEVELCGHATLAAAWVLWEILGCPREVLRFDTRAGELEVTRRGDLLAVSLPLARPRACDPPPGLFEALGRAPRELWRASESERSANLMAVYDGEDAVRGLTPDLAWLGRLAQTGVIATAPGNGLDIVSRYFAPAFGIPEDAATGSILGTLAPYWCERLGKRRLHAHQASTRGGELYCELLDDRVVVGGRVARYLEGTAYLDA